VLSSLKVEKTIMILWDLFIPNKRVHMPQLHSFVIIDTTK